MIQNPLIKQIILLSTYAARGGFFFIQVGSNDGVTDDPIHEYVVSSRWKGIVIEPVPYIFEKLKQTYRTCPGIIFENVAIDSEDGVRTFYRLEENDDQQVPEWYDLLGSFKKEAIVRQRDRISHFDDYLISEEIRCLSLSSLVRTHEIRRVDLLHIDAEGHDYEIIKSIPFAAVKPAMILYEHRLLSPDDARDCERLLKERGYTLVRISSYDTFAFSWRRLLRDAVYALFS